MCLILPTVSYYVCLLYIPSNLYNLTIYTRVSSTRHKNIIIIIYIYYIYIYIYTLNPVESNHKDGPTGHKKISYKEINI